jgi:hypothetical protein
MTMRVTMTQTRWLDASTQLASGSTYSLGDNLAVDLIGKGYATDTDGVLAARVTQGNPLSASAVAAVNAAIAADRLISGVLAQSAVPIVHTGTLSATILAEVTIPANAMGANGSVRVTAYWSMTNNANSKNLVIRFGGAATQMWSAGLSSVAAAGCQVSVHNRGATGSQVMNGGGTSASYGTMPAVVTSSEDTTQAQKIQFVGNLSNVGDTLTLERYTVEVLR